MGEPLPKERILQIAAQKGSFRVHRHRYRDDRIRARCLRIAREGLLFLAPAWMVRRKFRDDPREYLHFCPVQKDQTNG